MKIHFIGTGSAKTSLNDFHTSILFSSHNFNLLIDAGDGVSRALLASGINFNSLNGILITHLHPDHFSGLAALLVQMKLNNRKDPLVIFVYNALEKPVKDFIYQSYLFSERMDFKVVYKIFVENDWIEAAEQFDFISRHNSHLDHYVQYDKEKKLSFYCGSFLLKSSGINIFYTGDIGGKQDLLLFDDYSIDLLISEVTHINFDDLLEFKLHHKSTKIFLIHFDDINRKSLQSKIDKHKSILSGFEIAHAGQVITI